MSDEINYSEYIETVRELLLALPGTPAPSEVRVQECVAGVSFKKGSPGVHNSYSQRIVEQMGYGGFVISNVNVMSGGDTLTYVFNWRKK